MRRTTHHNENENENENEGDVEELWRESQLENSEKDKRIAQLERQLADMTNQPRSPPRQDEEEEDDEENPRRPNKPRARTHRALSPDAEEVARPAKRTHTDGADDSDKEPSVAPSQRGPPSPDLVATLGARFVTTCCPWLVHDDVISAEPDPTWDPSTRYTKIGEEFVEENIFQGQILDLLDLIPPQYHRYRATSDFIRSFKYGMQRRRQQYARRVRHNGKEKIFGYDWAAKMRTTESRREHFAQLIGFKPAQGSSKARYAILSVPLLHASECDKYKFSDAFKHPRLHAVLISLLRGEDSAESFINGNRKFKLSGREIQSLDRVKSMTPNLIATAIILARWALSEDGDFTRSGGVTGIDWLDHWNEYMLVLETALEDKTNRTIRKLFRIWDEAVFGSKTSPLGGDGDGDLAERGEELDDAMKQIEDDEYESE